MKKNKILSLIAVSLLTVSVLVGCGSKGTIDFSSAETTQEFKNDLIRFTMGAEEKYTADDFSKNLSPFLESLDGDEERDTYISYYVQGRYASATALRDKLNVLGFSIEDAIKEKDMKDLSAKSFSKLPDDYSTVKGFVSEVESKGFVLSRNVNTQLIEVSVDLGAVVKEYDKYMSNSLKDYFEFNDYENKAVFLENNSINIEEIATRIVTIEDGIDNDKTAGYKHIDKWMSSYEYYYEILLGIGHDYFISSEYFKDDVIAKYKELAEKYEDKELGQNLTKFIAVLEANNNKNSAEAKTTSENIIKDKYSANENEIENAIKNINPDVDEDLLNEIFGEMNGDTENPQEPPLENPQGN